MEIPGTQLGVKGANFPASEETTFVRVRCPTGEASTSQVIVVVVGVVVGVVVVAVVATVRTRHRSISVIATFRALCLLSLFFPPSTHQERRKSMRKR